MYGPSANAAKRLIQKYANTSATLLTRWPTPKMSAAIVPRIHFCE